MVTAPYPSLSIPACQSHRYAKAPQNFQPFTRMPSHLIPSKGIVMHMFIKTALTRHWIHSCCMLRPVKDTAL